MSNFYLHKKRITIFPYIYEFWSIFSMNGFLYWNVLKVKLKLFSVSLGQCTVSTTTLWDLVDVASTSVITIWSMDTRGCFSLPRNTLTNSLTIGKWKTAMNKSSASRSLLFWHNYLASSNGAWISKLRDAVFASLHDNQRIRFVKTM